MRPVSRDWPELLLRAMPGTISELTERTGAPKTCVKRWAVKLRRIGWAHVGDWRRSDGPGGKQPIIAAGPGQDAPEPPTMTPSELAHRFRAKAAQEGRYADLQAKYNASRRERQKERWPGIQRSRAKAKEKRRQRLASLFAPLTWTPTKLRPRNKFPDE